jgi:hypothetical protein
MMSVRGGWTGDARAKLQASSGPGRARLDYGGFSADDLLVTSRALRRKVKPIQSHETYPVLKALLVCGAGGALFSALRAPLPWMIGPLLVMAFGKFLGADLASPGPGDGQLIIGCALGLYFTPVVGHEVVAHWYLIAAAVSRAACVCKRMVLTRSAGSMGRRRFRQRSGGRGDDYPG